MNLSSSRPLAASLALVLIWLALGASSRAASVPAPDFELQRWETGEKIRLADFAGQIVALDFFAYWCGPCQRASAGVESGIQKHYAGRKGNPQGVPVRVVAVNIERDHPKLTAQLFQRAGLELVANDFDGAAGEVRRRGHALPRGDRWFAGDEGDAGFPRRHRHGAAAAPAASARTSSSRSNP